LITNRQKKPNNEESKLRYWVFSFTNVNINPRKIQLSIDILIPHTYNEFVITNN